MSIEVKVKAIDYLMGIGMAELAKILKANNIDDLVEIEVEFDHHPKLCVHSILLGHTLIESFEKESNMMNSIVRAILEHTSSEKYKLAHYTWNRNKLLGEDD